MIATIAEIKVQRSLRSYGNHSSAVVAIVATTIAEIDLSFISTTVALVAFFVAIATIAAIIWKPALTCLSAMNAQVKCAQTFTAIVLPRVHVISHALWTFLSMKTITMNLLMMVKLERKFIADLFILP